MFIYRHTDLVSSFIISANFKLPEEGSLFDTVEFVELQREDAQPLVEQYNKEGKDAQPPEYKRSRGGYDRNDRSSGYSRGGGRYGLLLFRNFCHKISSMCTDLNCLVAPYQ